MEEKIQIAKKFIITGYPPTKYFFTGKWIEQYTGYYKANKNKGKLLVPIYKSPNDEEIIDMTQAIKIDENSKRDKRLTGITNGYEEHLKHGIFPKNLEKNHNGKRS